MALGSVEKRWVVRQVGMVVAVAVAVIACSGGGGSSSGGVSATPSDLDSFIAQYCDALSPCCQPGHAYDRGKCTAFIKAFASSQVTYNGSNAGACLDAIHAAVQQPTFCTTGSSASSSSVCKSVLSGGSGGAAPGQVCTQDNDCASSAEGDVSCYHFFSSGGSSSGSTETRTCLVEARGKEGDPCVGTKTASLTETSIPSSPGTGAPTPTPTKVNICWTDDQLYCDNASKKCARSQDVGGACTTSSSEACVPTAYCDSSTKKCVARKNVGDACGGSGASGTSLSGGECAPASYCDTASASRKCAPSLADGAPCTSSDACVSKSCVNKVCTESSTFTTALICD